MTFHVNPNMAMLEKAADFLSPLLRDIVFIGGCAAGLLITDQAAPSVRVTLDVDVLTEASSTRGYHVLSERIRSLGFSEDCRLEAPICRWTMENFVLDILPTNSKILGFGNRWFKPAFLAAEWISIPSGKSIKILPAPYFLATKFEAFDGRGEGDFLLSRDKEDIVALIDGRDEIVVEIQLAETNLNQYLKNRLSLLLNNRHFKEALPGHLPPDMAGQARLGVVMERIRRIVEDGPGTLSFQIFTEISAISGNSTAWESGRDARSPRTWPRIGAWLY